ncbi:hypothetical protein SPMU_32270 [Sphingomonas mucosissima]|uniref:Uncharacterized protein n=2 Tax=Sphingomonas mucosissima TaxID=370959 RepID=A0A245ZE10_9SPHN|nr:hypothetical protein [Sphingomonas mucosissima]OWK27982.1 hypothetical protein SPMU_32270 [Sphingomonas mucosissima]
MAPATAPVATLAPVADNMLRVGTKVPLKLNEELTTKGKKLRVGQHFRMEVTEPVLVGGQVVIPAGSPAVGEITEVRNKGMWGKSGHLTAQMLYVSANGRQIRMTGTFDDKGVTGTGGVVAAIAFVPIAGFLTTGTSAKVPLGAAVTGFIGEDVPLMSAAAATPLMVQPTAPMVTTAPAASSSPALTPAVATTPK